MWACHAICKFITFSGYKSLIVMESLCVYVHICCICMQVYVPMCVSTSVPMPWYMCISQRPSSGVIPHLALVWDRVSCFLVHCCVSKLSSPWASGVLLSPPPGLPLEHWDADTCQHTPVYVGSGIHPQLLTFAWQVLCPWNHLPSLALGILNPKNKDNRKQCSPNPALTQSCN